MWNSNFYNDYSLDDVNQMMAGMQVTDQDEDRSGATASDSQSELPSYANPLIYQLEGRSPPSYTSSDYDAAASSATFHETFNQSSGQPHAMFGMYGAEPPVFYPPPMAFYESFAPGPSTVPGATLQVVRGRGESGCAISSIASVLGKTYDEVRPYAVRHGFTQAYGMTYPQMKATIKAMGGKAKIRYADEWAEVADLAIVSIRTDRGGLHAVAFERNDAGRFIYDNNNNGPIERPDDLSLAERKYLKIVKD